MAITLQKIAGGILFALILVVGLNLVVNGMMPKDDSVAPAVIAAAEGGIQMQAGQPAEIGAAAGAGPAAAPEEPLPQRLAAASVEKGREVAKRCQTCHTLNQGGGIKVGPNLWGVVGRPKASFPGFAYSDAVKSLGGTWTYADLDKFLTKPAAAAPGTKMTFAGLPNPALRADVIAYLRSISPNAPPLPK